MQRRLRKQTLVWIATGVLVIAAALIVAVLWPVTDLIAAHDVGTLAGPQRAIHLQTAREAVRTQLLTLGAGIFAAGALAFTGLNFVLSRRSFELTEQRQVTDRYTRAVEQLGSDKLDVRIGAIYAMERIARDSARDHPAVMEVLAAFVREHSREPWPLPAGSEAQERTTRPDVQAAVTVIGRRDVADESQPIDLNRANLTTANITRANLADANLYAADLTNSNLARSDLSGANLADAKLADASLWHANLSGTEFANADLSRADLSSANLPGASLYHANLTGAYLSHAQLTGVSFAGADITGADLTDATFADTGQPHQPELPDGWVVDAVTGLLRKAFTPPGR